VIWLDLPVVFDRALLAERGMPFRWSDSYPPRLGLMPRDVGAAGIRWVSVEPGYAFHVANAYEDSSGGVIVEAVVYGADAFTTTWASLGGPPPASGHPLMPNAGATLYRWRIDPMRGLLGEEPLDDLTIEFPTINGAQTGRGNRFTYAVHLPRIDQATDGTIVKYDRTRGTRTFHSLGEGWIPGEAVFVPAHDATAEDDGWLISIVTHATADAAKLLVHAASDIAAAPIATVHLPRQVPTGFHGAWIPERQNR
jgi:carotenoid cleavage dioxygenase